MRKIFFGTLAAALMVGAACTVHQTTSPALTGPSEAAHTLRLSTSTSSVTQDGASQARITVLAIDEFGNPKSGVTVRLDMQVNGVTQDFGTLSARTLVTGTDGTQFATFTAPPASPAPSSSSGTKVSIIASGTTAPFDNAQSSVDIRLVPPGVILPPADTPTPKFSFSPTAPTANQPTLFDASASCAGSSACTSTAGITSFVWNFGDGSAAGSGIAPSHTFNLNGTFNVTLTVTNTGGTQASTSSPVTVGVGNGPHADFVFSPTTPVVAQTVNFDATPSTPGAGHSIASYAWSFGDGTSKTGVTTTHDFGSPGTFNVILTVTDEAGQSSVKVGQVAVGAGNPTATFTASVFNGATHTMTFDASGSTAVSPTTIVSYAWAFGDGTFSAPPPSSSPTTNHTYLAAGTYQVRVTVVDSVGRSSSFTASVAVP